MIQGSCHCGAVRFEIGEHRGWLTECNCSVCRRYATLWLHSDVSRVTLECEPDATIAYVWGDKTLALHSCRTCGCTTHWISIDADEPDSMAVNCRMADPAEIAELPIRQFDGAKTWRYIDAPD